MTAVQPAPEPPVFTGRGRRRRWRCRPALPRWAPSRRRWKCCRRPAWRRRRPARRRPAPVVEFPPDYLPGLFRAALAAPASDVHLEAGRGPWGRVNGEVQPLDYGRALTADQLQAALFDLLPPEPRAAGWPMARPSSASPSRSAPRVRCAVFPGAPRRVRSCRLLAAAAAGAGRPPGAGLRRRPGARRSAAWSCSAACAVPAPRRRWRPWSTPSPPPAGVRIVTLEAPVEYLHRPDRALVDTDRGPDARADAAGRAAAAVAGRRGRVRHRRRHRPRRAAGGAEAGGGRGAGAGAWCASRTCRRWSSTCWTAPPASRQPGERVLRGAARRGLSAAVPAAPPRAGRCRCSSCSTSAPPRRR